MPIVFISSTKSDLREYRDGAIEVCDRLQLQHLAMEHFEAEGASGANSSKRQLDKADLYVGIVAHRYGEVTEVEFDHAGTRGIERICFVVDDSYPWPVDSIDFKMKRHLDKFKKRIGREVTRTKFTSVEDLKLKLIEALASWKERHNLAASETTSESISPALRAKPARPTLLIGREQDLVRLKQRFGILSSEKWRTLTILRGWPGVGKTTLINSLVYDDGVNEYFSDGVLWAVLGENGDPFSGLASWGRQLGIYDIANLSQLDDVITRLRAVLHNKKTLLIVDDAWEADHAIPFKDVAGPSCALLITTRFPDVAQRLANIPRDDIYLLEVLDDNMAFELLDRLAPDVTMTYSAEAQELVKALEGLPLAIRVAGRLLAEETLLGVDVRPLMKEIEDSHHLLAATAPDDRFDPITGTTPTIDLLLRRSTDLLDLETREYFAVLGAFAPKPATFDLDAMQFMWEKPNLGQTLKIVRKLVGRGLLEPIPTVGRFQMHAVLVKLAQSLLEHADDQSSSKPSPKGEAS